MKGSGKMVIGVGGISRSGKTSLAEALRSHFTSHGLSIRLISMDDFVKDPKEIPLIRDQPDWEHPDSIDWERLIKEIGETREKMVLLEGIFINDEHLSGILDRRIMIRIDRNVFWQRREKEKRWGAEPEWYLEHVWKTNLELNEPAEKDIVVSGNSAFPVEEVIQKLNVKEFLAGPQR